MSSAPALAGPDAEMTVAETLSRWPRLTAVFVRRGMACPGCAMAELMTLREAARAYGFGVDQLLADLGAALP